MLTHGHPRGLAYVCEPPKARDDGRTAGTRSAANEKPPVKPGVSMQERGVEPLHLSVQDPKSCASANSATPAASQPAALSIILRTVSNQGELGDLSLEG